LTKPKKTAREVTTEIQREVTDRIVAQLEAGVVPWVKPWSSDPMSMPMNPASKHVYSGSNVLLLWIAMMAGFSTARFMTWNQAQELGARVKDGQEKLYFKVTKYGLGKKEDKKTGERAGPEGAALPKTDKTIPFLKVYRVYNVDQIEGLPEEMYARPVPKPLPERLDDVEAFVASTKAVIEHGRGRAAYSPTVDKIVMPFGGDFVSKEAYYATLLHELTHWTGHKSRLDRFTDKTDAEVRGKSYAFEELVAELGAAFLCAELGIEGQLQHAEYIGHWIEGLKGNPKVIFDAAKHASAATKFMHEIGESIELPVAA
jgi:antirestriction protein ArdC